MIKKNEFIQSALFASIKMSLLVTFLTRKDRRYTADVSSYESKMQCNSGVKNKK